jgi:hypothetical protein
MLSIPAVADDNGASTLETHAAGLTHIATIHCVLGAWRLNW